MTGLFEGSYLGDKSRLAGDAKLECGICWHVYDPEKGDAAAQIPSSTPFSALPDDWVCPSCTAPKTKFMVMADEPSETADPLDAASAVNVAYRSADKRMKGLPVHNPALSVESLGFRRMAGASAGIAITPWMMSIVCVPDAPSGMVGDHVERAFPAGSITMTVARLETEEGQPAVMVETCSLFSPMAEFSGMDAARVAAQAVLGALFSSPETEGAGDQAGEDVRSTAMPAARPDMNRRAFLTGRSVG